MPALKPRSESAKKQPRRSVERTVHQLFLEHAPESYRRNDRKLRLVGLAGVGVLLLGLGVGSAVDLKEVMGIGAALGLALFGVALFKASGHYKRAFRAFTVSSLASDGTFPFCPNCRYDLRGGTTIPTTCPECGAAPWKFEKPDEAE